MLISFLKNNNGYLVYITASKRKKTFIGIAYEMNCFRIEITKEFSRLVYFEKFSDRSKAKNRKKYLEKRNYDKIKKLVSKRNPDWLDLIMTLTEVKS
jgi:predicted GIY-YIG superfamily endonuclease